MAWAFPMILLENGLEWSICPGMVLGVSRNYRKLAMIVNIIMDNPIATTLQEVPFPLLQHLCWYLPSRFKRHKVQCSVGQSFGKIGMIDDGCSKDAEKRAFVSLWRFKFREDAGMLRFWLRWGLCTLHDHAEWGELEDASNRLEIFGGVLLKHVPWWHWGWTPQSTKALQTDLYFEWCQLDVKSKASKT